MENKKVLVVDDEPDLTYLCKMVLEDEGYSVDAFSDSLEALSSFKPNIYDLVILDIKMPHKDGFELYRKIKELDTNVKICFLTASEMYYEKFREEEYTSIGKDLFIHKPIENEELIKKIKKILNSSGNTNNWKI
ncbi:MAG: response regulator [Nitrosopumilus sp.]|nr:response regulator [Nitrosopumilus sp.]